MSESSRAVFLSYASQDSAAAARICTTLQAAGVEVFLDQSELRGGDAWDQRIRREIQACALFVPVISQHTQDRLEGYFRREWKLAIDRSQDMAEEKPFLVPVVIDRTSEQEAVVPERFRSVQWTRLPGGETPPEFVERVRQLLTASVTSATKTLRPAAATAPPDVGNRPRPSERPRRAWLAMSAVVIAVVAGYFLIEKPWLSKSAAFAPPAHSIAVLPFVNLSGDPTQEYFSEGLTEELLNSLADIQGLQVAARTSSFSFKEQPDIVTVAHKLNVAAVLEGSVRRSERKIRITAQLINAVTGYHLWSKTYDRDLGDVLKLQTEIATAVAEALKVTLLGNVAVKIELGGTRNPAAFDAYLRGLKLARIAAATTPMECKAPIDAFSEAITLDSGYALAYAARALLKSECIGNTPEWLQQPTERSARTDAERSVALAPDLAEGYGALARIEMGVLNLGAAHEACAHSLALAPGDVVVLQECSLLAAYLGHSDAGIEGARHSVALDPLNPLSHRALGDVLRYARHYPEAVAAYQASIAADPEHSDEADALSGISYYLAGNLTLAQSSCEKTPGSFRGRLCLAVIYHRLGRQHDAAAALAGMTEQGGDAAAYQYAEVYSQWGDRKAGLDWLEKGMRLRDPGMMYTKVDPLLDPLRADPRFQAVLRELNVPE